MSVLLFGFTLCGLTHGQAGSCSYTLAPNSISVGSTGTNDSLSMTAGSTCGWTAATTNSWIQPVNSGTGNGTIFYAVLPNTNLSARVGVITAGGKTAIINQAAAPISFGQALDNSLVWETSPDYPWYGTMPPAPTFDGLYSAASGNKYKASTTSWLQTTVVGPGKLSFWWKVDSDVTLPYSFDELEFDLNGVMQDQIMGQIDWNYRSYNIPAGTNVLTWQYVKDAQYNSGGDQAWLDQVSYTTGGPMALQEALNTCGLLWTSGGNSNPTVWAGQSDVTHDGKAAARSGAVSTSQESWLQTVVVGVTNLSFWWKVSSQTNYDYLEFYTNATLVKRISGEVDWRSNNFPLVAPTNTLMWRFVKTNFNVVSIGQNCGWLDQVTVSPAPKAFPYSLSSPVTQLDGRVQLSILGEAGCPCQVQFSTNLAYWNVLTNLTTTSTNMALIDPSPLTVPGGFYRALSP